ncbi:helix-turn-helix domain-containing protein [Streptomyces sp. NPDC059564]|uniref:helix-turn-helix domain-containing protein n=1 Tax=Streptomyces sp. NPDC059564 TaxID=3346865 RepID=UPI00368A8479
MPSPPGCPSYATGPRRGASTASSTPPTRRRRPAPASPRWTTPRRRGAAVLLETLRTWLSVHCAWDQAAAALRVHRNTVRHRIGRVAELLDTDLQDPDVRMELWSALRWLPGELAASPPGHS